MLFALCWLSLASCACIWLLGALAAPAYHPELARVVWGSPAAPKRLAGAAFDCAWNHQLSLQQCSTELEGGALRLAFSDRGCEAHYQHRSHACRSDYGEVLGLRSIRIESSSAQFRPRLATWPTHFLGTRSECEWGSIARAAALLVPFALALLLGSAAPPLKRRWGLRFALAALSVPPAWLLLMLTLLHWGYVD